MMQAAASLFNSSVSRVSETLTYFKGPKVEEQKSPIDAKVDTMRESVLLEETHDSQPPAVSQEVGHSFAPITREENSIKEGSTLQKIVDVAKETIQSKASTLSAATAKYSTTFADQALSRLSKFGLAVKSLTSDVLMSPFRAINVPVQLALGFGLLGQFVYRSSNPPKDLNKYNAAELKARSMSVFANAFGSSGAAVLPILGNTIGLITAPVFNTKHFTGKLGPLGMKMLIATQAVLLDHRKTTEQKKEAFTSRLSQVNNPRILHKIQHESGKKLSFFQQVKLIFDNKKIGVPKDIYETKLKEKSEMFKKGGALFFLAGAFYNMSLRELSLKATFYVKMASDPSQYDDVKQEMQSSGEIRTRNRSGAVLQRRKTSVERELDAIIAGVNKVQNQETQNKPEERDRRDTIIPPAA